MWEQQEQKQQPYFNKEFVAIRQQLVLQIEQRKLRFNGKPEAQLSIFEFLWRTEQQLSVSVPEAEGSAVCPTVSRSEIHHDSRTPYIRDIQNSQTAAQHLRDDFRSWSQRGAR